jgi:hypothetical protein
VPLLGGHSTHAPNLAAILLTMYVCVRACVRVCVRACVCAFVCVCVRVCVFLSPPLSLPFVPSCCSQQLVVDQQDYQHATRPIHVNSGSKPIRFVSTLASNVVHQQEQVV